MRPVLSTVTQPSASASQPRPTRRGLFGTKRGGTNSASAGDDAAVAHLHAAQVVRVVDDQLFDGAFDDADGAGEQLGPLGGGRGCQGGGEVDEVGGSTGELVVWGDQVHVSGETLARARRCHGGDADRVALPLVSLPKPYVEYRFDDDGRLTAVLQAREGDECRPGGRGDVGTFVLSTPRLVQEWELFRADSLPGARTGEVNFLPFLVRLAQRGWAVQPIDVGDPREARGVNTVEDPAFFRQLYADPSRE